MNTAIATKPRPKPALAEQKTKAIAEVTNDAELPLSKRLESMLMKAITKTNNGAMTADALTAVTAAVKLGVESQSFFSSKK